MRNRSWHSSRVARCPHSVFLVTRRSRTNTGMRDKKPVFIPHSEFRIPNWLFNHPQIIAAEQFIEIALAFRLGDRIDLAVEQFLVARLSTAR